MDTLVWTIAHGGRVAHVGEDGDMSGDEELVALLETRMREPITVYRTGTVQSLGGKPPAPILLQPGDRRYVVARIRTLCDADPEFEVVDFDWR